MVGGNIPEDGDGLSGYRGNGFFGARRVGDCLGGGVGHTAVGGRPVIEVVEGKTQGGNFKSAFLTLEGHFFTGVLQIGVNPVDAVLGVDVHILAQNHSTALHIALIDGVSAPVALQLGVQQHGVFDFHRNLFLRGLGVGEAHGSGFVTQDGAAGDDNIVIPRVFCLINTHDGITAVGGGSNVFQAEAAHVHADAVVQLATADEGAVFHHGGSVFRAQFLHADGRTLGRTGGEAVEVQGEGGNAVEEGVTGVHEVAEHFDHGSAVLGNQRFDFLCGVSLGFGVAVDDQCDRLSGKAHAAEAGHGQNQRQYKAKQFFHRSTSCI